jgi:hypothetical protein
MGSCEAGRASGRSKTRQKQRAVVVIVEAGAGVWTDASMMMRV